MIPRHSMTLVCALLVMGTRTTSADDKGGGDVLDRFVGVWKVSDTVKPAKWTPEGGKIAEQESTVWALKRRLVLIRAINPAEKRKSLWIATYDAKQNAYPFWGFDSRGLSGAQWRLTWDAPANKAVGHATDLARGWTSGGSNHFTDADTNVIEHWIKNENGDLMFHHIGKKERQPAKSEAAVVAAWKKHEPADNLPAELKVLDRMVGTWDAVSTMKPAEWTPDGGRSTMKITREWILNGRFVMDTPLHSNGQEGMTIIGFDPNQKVYQGWRFNSEGEFPRSPFKGSWNAKSQTLSYVGKLEDGKTNRSSVRFFGRNQEVWEIKVTDADGKVYFDMDTIATRRAKASQ